jgi:hypothetical protein
VGTRKKTLHEDNEVVEIVEVVPRDRGVDLHGQIDLACPAHSIERAFVRPFHLAELVVLLGGRGVERNGEASEAGVLQFLDGFFREQRSGARR